MAGSRRSRSPGRPRGWRSTGSVVVHGDGGPRTFSLDGGPRRVRLHQGDPAPQHRLALGLRDRAARRRDRPRLQPRPRASPGSGSGHGRTPCGSTADPSALDARTRFEFDRSDVMQPWHVTTQDGTVRLRFDPVAAHNEFLDVKAVRSLFIQPVGHFSGEIDVDGRTHVLDRVPGCRRGLGHPLVARGSWPALEAGTDGRGAAVGASAAH